MLRMYIYVVHLSKQTNWSSRISPEVFQTYMHSIALDRALASFTGFMIVRYIRCGVISPTIKLVLATWYDHQGHLLAKPADTTLWRGRWNAGEKYGCWILLTSTYHAHRILLHAVNLWHGTDGFTSPPKKRRVADFITLKIHRPRLGLNPRTLGPVASTLTTRPLRATEVFQSTVNIKLLYVLSDLDCISDNELCHFQGRWII
jgi:hypothetical protein